MPVKVLIIDDVATNRIVLKVKLSAASYDVSQAGSARESLEIAEREAPDIIVVAAVLDGESSADLIRKLSARHGPAPGNILALSETDCPATRLELMRAGAFDVLAKPLCDKLLQARLRSVSRRRHEWEDLALSADKAEALGFDEAPRSFAPRGRILALDPGAEAPRRLLQGLMARNSHAFGFCASGTTSDVTGAEGPPDVMLVLIAGHEDEAGLTQLAELRLADPTRHARLIAVLCDASPTLASRVLDLGADDVLGQDAPPEEAELRLNAQVQGKRSEDSLRRRLQTSLEAAITDPLTGLYNRRYALSALGRLVDTVMREGGSFAVMVADLDHFKTVNDTYGHSAGDIALKRVAEQCQTGLRPGDILSRFGGEEFLILLPGADDKSAREAADRLRMRVRDTDILIPGQSDPIRVTISIGVTVAHGTGHGGRPSVEALLGTADQALYTSKSGGRDSVSFNHSSAA